ncbi:ABC transporter ATP-binding protein [Novispirillum itersonii]|uniref:Putative ABC transport system ATP-binding protein n=1 Tax=Novispirillum itersonii TaxID=189 RepID=A0A7W9ZEZ7_NOVIT|nr:ABC transporter ATP-binding protein [Novispirillum itersonii]MBB6209878.1 putative ABC transport system ATP-binding protein [Novispirillum itersonii]
MSDLSFQTVSKVQAPDYRVEMAAVEVTLSGVSGTVDILRGVDLTVSPGEAVGLIGPSGSGKSTLLMVMAGLEQATAGQVRICGADFTRMGEDALAVFRRDHIGVVFQSFHLIPTMTALENVAVPLELAGHRDAFDRAEAELRAVGLGHRLHHYPPHLSGGEQQRVALARAFAPRPALLLADEPTGNLDGTTGAAIMDLLFDRRAAAGSTLVLITHDPALAARCDRVVRVQDGLIVAAASPAVPADRPAPVTTPSGLPA